MMKNLWKQALKLLKSGVQPTFTPKAIDLFDGLIVKLSKTYDAGQLPKKFENEAGLGNLYPLGANAVFLAVYAKLNKKIPFKEKNKALHEFIDSLAKINKLITKTFSLDRGPHRISSCADLETLYCYMDQKNKTAGRKLIEQFLNRHNITYKTGKKGVKVRRRFLKITADKDRLLKMNWLLRIACGDYLSVLRTYRLGLEDSSFLKNCSEVTDIFYTSEQKVLYGSRHNVPKDDTLKLLLKITNLIEKSHSPRFFVLFHVLCELKNNHKHYIPINKLVTEIVSFFFKDYRITENGLLHEYTDIKHALYYALFRKGFQKRALTNNFIGFEGLLDLNFIGENALELHRDILSTIVNFWKKDVPEITVNALKKYINFPGVLAPLPALLNKLKIDRANFRETWLPVIQYRLELLDSMPASGFINVRELLITLREYGFPGLANYFKEELTNTYKFKYVKRIQKKYPDVAPILMTQSDSGSSSGSGSLSFWSSSESTSSDSESELGLSSEVVIENEIIKSVLKKIEAVLKGDVGSEVYPDYEKEKTKFEIPYQNLVQQRIVDNLDKKINLISKEINSQSSFSSSTPSSEKDFVYKKLAFAGDYFLFKKKKARVNTTAEFPKEKQRQESSSSSSC